MSTPVKLALWLALSLAGSAAPPTAPGLGKAGKLIIAGGGVGSVRTEIWENMLRHRLPDRPIGIISTAVDDPLTYGASYAAGINRDFGDGSAVAVPMGEGAGGADDPEIISLLRSCGGFYFSGGLQARTSRFLKDGEGRETPALKAVWEVYRKGGVIGGSSAGAAVMSDPMISGGNSSDALLRGATPLDTPNAGFGVGYLAGLGFHPGVLYCQHHLERGRFGRLLAALASDKLGQTMGVGVAENTAFLVDHQRQTGTVIGGKGVIFIDRTALRRGADGGFSGVRLHYLDRGDSIHFPTGGISPAEGKIAVNPGDGADSFEVDDPWARDAIWTLLTDLAPMSPKASARAKDGRFDLFFAKTRHTKVWRQPDEAEATRPTWTLSDIHVSVVPAARGD